MRSEPLFDRALKHIQSPTVAQNLAKLIAGALSKVDGFDDLPEPLRQEISQRVAELYGVGFVQGARWNED